MSTTLLATKLHRPPPPPRLVGRPHLLQRLDEGLQSGCQLTLISAPAGFGKSTCASQWLKSLDRPTAWLSLDPSDDDPTRFLAYLVAALQKIDLAIGREVEGLLRRGQPPPIEALLAALLNDVQTLGQNFCLVLDDFQVLQQSSILKAMEMLLANQPPNLHLVLVTRADPQLPLARLRANHQMNEIRASDLRFTRSEAERFLNELMELSLSESDVAALDERTEGWVVGLQLAGLSMRDRADRPAFIAHLSGSHRHILGYLTEEVLHRQHEAVQAFLLQTSILEELNGELCDAVTGRSPGSSQALLEELFSANLFLIPLDDEGRWFRYHHLFADLLQARLGQAFSPQDIAGLHMRAAAWFEAQAQAGKAVDHSLAARDFTGAARLIEQYADPLLGRGELVTLLHWIEVLPAEFARLHPLILVAKAWTLTLAGAVRQVEPVLREAEALVEPGEETPEAQILRGNAAAIRSFFAMLAGEYPRALELAEQAEALLPESSVNARALLPYTTGASYRAQNQYPRALEAFQRVARMGEVYGDLLTWATGVTEIANIHRYQGRLGAAAETCAAALQRMKERRVERFGSLAKVEVPLIEVLREQNQIEEALQRVNDVLARMQAWAMPTDRIFAYLALIRIQQAQRDLAGTAESLRVAQELKASHPVLIALASAVDICEIRYHLDRGDTPTAGRLAESLATRPGFSRIYSLHEQGQIMLARVRLAQGRPQEASDILSALAADPSAALRTGTLAEIKTLQAQALAARGEHKAAVKRLLEALALAEPEGFVRLFVDEGQALQPLLAAALPTAGSPEMKAYIARVLAAFPPGPAPEAAPPTGEAAALPEPLTERELDVLRLIAEGLKYHEIAARLFISLNTVRTYVKAIYGKLGANNRTQAVARAHEMKLI